MSDQPIQSIARAPTAWDVFLDRSFQRLTLAFAWLTILAVVFLLWQVGKAAHPAVQKYGASFLVGTNWDSGKENFGIGPEIWGTLYSSVLGVAIGSFLGLSVAIFLTQDFVAPRFELIFKNVIELLAAIPSVVYGLWGIFVVIPTIRPAANWLHAKLPWVPFFETPLVGPGLLPAALVLAIMVLPTVAAVSRDALCSVPIKLREAAFGLGATRWETILAVVLPTASRGVYGAIILAFGRALGETMALAMLVGNSNNMEHKWSMLAPADTLAALLANRFAEASSVEVGALMYAALVLMAITLLVNIIGAFIIMRTSAATGGTVK
jgi:phosphate transport system permease protein